MHTAALTHRVDTGRPAGRCPYVSGGPKCLIRCVFGGRAKPAGPLNVRYERCLALSRAPQAADGGPISVLRRAKGCGVVGHRNIDVGGDRKLPGFLVSAWGALFLFLWTMCEWPTQGTRELYTRSQLRCGLSAACAGVFKRDT